MQSILPLTLCYQKFAFRGIAMDFAWHFERHKKNAIKLQVSVSIHALVQSLKAHCTLISFMKMEIRQFCLYENVGFISFTPL